MFVNVCTYVRSSTTQYFFPGEKGLLLAGRHRVIGKMDHDDLRARAKCGFDFYKIALPKTTFVNDNYLPARAQGKDVATV